MFADSLFMGLKGTGKRQVEDFEVLFDRRLKEMRESVGKDGVSEETHHVGLACELVHACLQQRPEDRWVRVTEGYGMREIGLLFLFFTKTVPNIILCDYDRLT